MKAKSRYLKYRISKGYRKLVRLVCRRLYRDTNRDTDKSILVAGAARSGTTWLADIIAWQLSCRIMFEPFHSKLIPQYKQFNYYQYMRPEVDNPELYTYAHKIFTGDIRNPWIDRQVETIFPHYRVIKAVRANLFLKWLHNRFPVVPQLLIMRHPCAVVLSRLQLGWDTDSDIKPFLSQDELVQDYLMDKMNIIQHAKTDEEKHAIIWCVSNLIPLQQFKTENLNVVFYENICTQPEIEIPRIFHAINLDYKDSVYAKLNVPTTTSLSTSAVITGEDRITNWERKLSTTQVDKILKVVETFDLDHIYGNSYMPLISESII